MPRVQIPIQDTTVLVTGDSVGMGGISVRGRKYIYRFLSKRVLSVEMYKNINIDR